jgi:hypothetical protein
MKEIASALVKAQKGFGPALKTSTNPAFRSKYASLENCIEAVIDSLNDNGIMLMQPTHLCEDGVIIETVFLHESGEQISAGRLHVPATKHDAQGYGSALSYARRYSLLAACGIATEDDDGNNASKPKAAPVKQAPAQAATQPATSDVKAPVRIEGKDTPWQLKVVAKPDGNHGEWSQLVIDATMLQLEQAKSEANVMDIFKTNRNIYDEVKSGSPTAYDILMDEFKQARNKHKEPA